MFARVVIPRGPSVHTSRRGGELIMLCAWRTTFYKMEGFVKPPQIYAKSLVERHTSK